MCHLGAIEVQRQRSDDACKATWFGTNKQPFRHVTPLSILTILRFRKGVFRLELGKCEGAGLQLCPPGPQEVSWMMMRAHCTVLQTVFVDGEKEKVILLFFRSRW